MIHRVLDRLTGERGPLLLALLAVLISLPALRLGFQADDHILATQWKRGEPAWSLFQANESLIEEGRRAGAVAWWASPQMRGEFLRPLSSLSLAVMLEWSSPAWLMVLVNILVYGASVWMAALVYRKVASLPSSAALAGLLFAIDDAHAHSVGWISGRNTIMALLGSIAALWFHIRGLESGQRRYAIASVLAVIFALASGEGGTWAFAFLIAYAWALDPRPNRVRLSSLAPHFAIGLVWAAIYMRGHYGIHHASWYYPVWPPTAALAQGLLNVPLTVTSLFGPSMVGLTILEPLWKARLALLPVALVLLWLVWPAQRASKALRFFGLATVLGVLPTFLTVPQDRVLIGAGFGALGWIASVLTEGESLSDIRHRLARVVLRGCHIWMAAVLFIPMLAAQYRFEVGAKALRAQVKADRLVVLINTPVELIANYTVAMIDLENDPDNHPIAVHQLYAGGSELWVERTSDRAIELTAARGWGYVPVERIFCTPEDMPRPGDERRVNGMAVRTLEGNQAGMPTRVRFTFDDPLEAGPIDWLVWTEAGHPVPWHPPALGQRVRIAPMNMLKALP